MPFIQIKNFFLPVVLTKSVSNLDTFSDIGRLCSKVVWVLIMGVLRDSVRLVNWSR